MVDLRPCHTSNNEFSMSLCCHICGLLACTNICFREAANMAEGQPRAVAPVDCKECARQFPTFKVFSSFKTGSSKHPDAPPREASLSCRHCLPHFQVYIKHLLAKECSAAQNSSIRVIWLPPTIQCFKKSVITGEPGSPFVPTPDSG